MAAFYLLIVTALWGLTFPLIGESMETQDPFLYVSLRFSLAAIFVLPYFLRHITKKTLLVGVILGLIQCGVFIPQSLGLGTVDPSRSAFLTGINVLFVPFLAPFFRMGSPSRHDVISAIICCLGIYVLTGGNISDISSGDLWIIGAAFLISVSIVYIGRHAKSSMDPLMLSYSQIVMTALFSWVPTLLFSDMDIAPFLTTKALFSLSICSIFATIVALTLQAKYQKYASLQNTALIFSLEPVFAAIFTALMGGTLPTIFTFCGGAIILCSILYLELLRPKEVLEAAA